MLHKSVPSDQVQGLPYGRREIPLKHPLGCRTECTFELYVAIFGGSDCIRIQAAGQNICKLSEIGEKVLFSSCKVFMDKYFFDGTCMHASRHQGRCHSKRLLLRILHFLQKEQSLSYFLF